MASMVAGEEAAATTTTTRRLTSSVWVGYTINRPADGGAPTATCLECGLTLCAGGHNGTSHLRRHTSSKKCQQLAAERELCRRQQTSPTTAAEPSSSDDDDDDYYSPLPPPVVDVVEDEELKDLFTVDGMYIPDLFDKLIAESLSNIDQPNVPALAQAPSPSTRRFNKKKKEMQVRKAENKKRCAPDDESGLHASAQPDLNLRRKRT